MPQLLPPCPATATATATDYYENMPIQTYWKFYHQKMKIFR